MPKFQLNRRRFLTTATLSASTLALSGCDAFDFLADRDNGVRNVLEGANDLTYRVQRLLAGRESLAQEFTEPTFGSRNAPTASLHPTTVSTNPFSRATSPTGGWR